MELSEVKRFQNKKTNAHNFGRPDAVGFNIAHVLHDHRSLLYGAAALGTPLRNSDLVVTEI